MPTTTMADDVEVDLDSVITRLLEGIASYSSPHTPLYSPFLSPPSERNADNKDRAASGERSEGVVHESQGDFSQSTNSTGVGGTTQDMW